MVDGKPVDALGNPLPWITYPAVDFLSGRIFGSLRVFEWGSGSSTEWWARQVQEVVACEHDPAWYSQVSESLPSNATVLLRDRGEDYTNEVLKHGLFDIVVIDGRDRVECSRVAPDALSPAGVIIWDNSNRERYRKGLEALSSQGFRRVDFHGLVPALRRPGVTSFLYRSDNIFEL